MNHELLSAGEWLLRASWQAAVLAVLIFTVQWLFGSKLSARWRYRLWMLVVLRLVLPAVPATQWSVHNWIALPGKSTPTPLKTIDQPVQAELSVVVLQTVPQAAPIRTSTPPPVISAAPRNDWRDYAIPAAWSVWLAGFCFFFIRTLIATAKLAMQSRRFTRITDPQILHILDNA